MSKDAVDGFFPVLVDPIEQHSKCLHRVLGLAQQPGLARVEGFAVFDVDVGDLVVLEKG